MAHALCAIEVPDTFGQNQHKPFAIMSDTSHVVAQSLVRKTVRVSLLDRRLRGGLVN